MDIKLKQAIEDAKAIKTLDNEIKSEPPSEVQGVSYFAGMSTAIDVRRLNEAIDLREGEEITHDRIEKILGKHRDTCRYKTVVGKWRRHVLASFNFLLLPRAGVGYLVAFPDERIAHAATQQAAGFRRIYRAADVAASTDLTRLPASARKQAEHIIGIKSRLLLAEEAGKLS